MDKSKEKFSKVPGNRDQREQVYEDDVNIILGSKSSSVGFSRKGRSLLSGLKMTELVSRK